MTLFQNLEPLKFYDLSIQFQTKDSTRMVPQHFYRAGRPVDYKSLESLETAVREVDDHLKALKKGVIVANYKKEPVLGKVLSFHNIYFRIYYWEGCHLKEQYVLFKLLSPLKL